LSNWGTEGNQARALTGAEIDPRLNFIKTAATSRAERPFPLVATHFESAVREGWSSSKDQGQFSLEIVDLDLEFLKRIFEPLAERLQSEEGVTCGYRASDRNDHAFVITPRIF